MIVLARLTAFVWLISPAVTAATDGDADNAQELAGPRTGYFRVSLTPLQLFGSDGAARVADVFDATEVLSWQLYVPPSYDSSNPAGAIVYVSPRSVGGPPTVWNEVLGERNLIWIGAQNASDDVPLSRRMYLAMFAPMVLQRGYMLNPERVYIAGFSSGGMTASRVATLYPNVFKGGIFVNGALFWDRGPPPLIDTIRTRRYVFIAGSRDTAMGRTKSVHRKFLDAGVDKSKLMVLPNLGYALPDRLNFERAIDYLDGNDAE